MEVLESMIFRLSPRLGGRSEVLSAPIFELLRHMDLEEKREEAERMDKFLMLFYANPMVDPKIRQEYVNSISPKKPVEELKLETNYDQLKAIKEAQGKKKGG